MKYPAVMVDGNGVPKCTTACPRATTAPGGYPVSAGRIWCGETESEGCEYETCYAWAADKASSDDEFPNSAVPF